MDRADVEPHRGLHESVTRLQELLRGSHWVIVGGESGKKARPMKPEWVENVKRQCDAAAVAFFFKQWGAWGADGQKRSKHANGRRYRGKVWDRMPAIAQL